MADELWDTLLKFHREVAMPSIVTEIGGPLREEIAALDRKMEGRFDGVYQRLDRLGSEYHALTAMEHRPDSTAAQSELLELRWRVSTLEVKIAERER